MQLQKNKNSFRSVLEDMEGFSLNTLGGVGQLVCVEGGDLVAPRWGGQPGMKSLLV